MYVERSRRDGRITMVAGVAQGIGHSAAEALSKAGVRVILVDQGAEEATERLRGAARKASRTTSLPLRPPTRCVGDDAVVRR